jgi:hypothetical protein
MLENCSSSSDTYRISNERQDIIEGGQIPVKSFSIFEIVFIESEATTVQRVRIEMFFGVQKRRAEDGDSGMNTLILSGDNGVHYFKHY